MEQLRQHVPVKPAVVIAVNADGTYKVLPESGRGYGTPIDGVRSLLESTLSVPDRVVLVWPRPGEHPWILVSDSGGCGHGLTDFGIITD